MNRKRSTGMTSEKTPQDLGGSMAYEYDRLNGKKVAARS